MRSAARRDGRRADDRALTATPAVRSLPPRFFFSPRRQHFIAEPGENDVPVSAVFTDEMFAELKASMAAVGWTGLEEVRARSPLTLRKKVPHPQKVVHRTAERFPTTQTSCRRAVNTHKHDEYYYESLQNMKPPVTLTLRKSIGQPSDSPRRARPSSQRESPSIGQPSDSPRRSPAVVGP